MSTAAPSLPTCPFCDKQGLPILPVRHAIARTDMGHAPSLPSSFGTGITDIALPGDIAKYTLRLLRPGYLYVYDEHRREWSGYVVNNQSYLWEFDIHAKTPPKVENNKTFNAICRGRSDPYAARCITVKSSARATKVWLGFSDVAWTPAVLARHDSADYRQAHMQCIDMAAWRNGNPQPHMTSFDALQHVAEFAADGIALHRETRAYVRDFFPDPFKLPEDIKAPNAAARDALSLLSPMITSLLDSACGTPVTHGLTVAAAWAFSPQILYLTCEETTAMTAWGNPLAKPFRPAIVGIADPAGIAMELNGLAIQRSVEFTDNRSRKWKYETAQLIAGLKENIGNLAIDSELDSRRRSAEMSGAWSVAKMGYLTPSDFNAHRARIEQSEILSKTEQKAVTRDAWDDYAKYIDRKAWEDYLGTDTRQGTYQKELDGFTDHILKHLDTAYIAWLKSPALQRYLTHNFDPHDARSGEAYLDVVRLLIAEASGRSAVFQLLNDLLQQDPHHPEAWLMRALALNHEPLIQAWSTAALEKATESVFESASSWAELTDKFCGGYNQLVGSAIDIAANPRPPGTTFADKVARLVYQISGPLSLRLSASIDQGLAAALPARFQMGVLGAVAKVGNPDMMVVDLRGMWNRKEATRTLAGMLAKLSGGDAAAYRSGVRTVLDTLAKADGTRHPYHGVMLVDTAKARMLSNVPKAGRAAAIGGMLAPQQFDEIMQEGVGRIAKLDVKVGVVQMVFSSVTLVSAYRQMMKAKPGEVVGKVVNFASGVIGIIAAASTAVGSALENTSWGASRLAKQYRFFAIQIETRAGWFTAVGKLFGALGGAITGVMAMKDAWDIGKNHTILAILSGVAGFVAIAISIIAITWAGASALVLGIIGIFVGIVLFVVAWLKPNAVQDWLERSLYFGKGEAKFDNARIQQQALEALQQGG